MGEKTEIVENKKSETEVMEKSIKENNKSNSDSKKIKKSKKWLIIALLIIIILAILIIGFVFAWQGTKPKNMQLEAEDLHTISVSWEDIRYVKKYDVILSQEQINLNTLISELKNEYERSKYQIISSTSTNKIKATKLSANTAYYVVIVGYYEINGQKIYTVPSDISKIYTKTLEIGKVENLKAVEITDTSVKLTWNLWTTEQKNSDGSDVQVMYDIYRKKDEKDELIKDNLTEVEYTINELTPLTRIYYKVLPKVTIDGQEVKGIEGEKLEVITKAQPIDVVNASTSEKNSIKISWSSYDKNSLKNEDGTDTSVSYSVYGADSEQGEFSLLADNIEETNYTEEDLAENKTRYYYVIANIKTNTQTVESIKSDIKQGKTSKTVVTRPSGTSGSTSNGGTNNSSSSSNSSSSENTGSTDNSGLSDSEKQAKARVIARQIAKSATGSTELERVANAALAVSKYTNTGTYTTEGRDYRTAYGLFIKGEFSCAGTARAMGMVLEEMGFTWQHANPNQWTHQWAIVTMGGQKGWADGMIGMAGYGEYPFF